MEDQRITWVGDAKYKRLPSGAYRNADLYQLLAYAVATRLTVGTLIYAADEGASTAEHVVLQAGKRLNIIALDLRPPCREPPRDEIIAHGIGEDVAWPDVTV